MTSDLVEALNAFPFETIYIVIAFGTLRCFAFTFSFLPFGWGFGSGVMLRMTFSVLVMGPATLINYSVIGNLSGDVQPLELVLLGAKEFAVGFGIGLLASSPFRAMQYAGGIIDSFRGETDSGLQAPDGSPLQTLSVLYLVIGFSVFFSAGGLWIMIDTIYASYAIWPIDTRLPLLSKASADIALLALDRAFQLALVIAAPIMILLATVEIVLMLAAKIARRFGPYDLSFLVKNLLTIVTLPLMAMLMVRTIEANFGNFGMVLDSMETYFDE